MLTPPIEPMLAKPLGGLLPPDDPALVFEPKWDGFRCLVFRSDDGVVLQGRGRSRNPGDAAVDLGYAFPELVAACSAQLAPGSLIDAEIVVPHLGRLDFSALSSRLRPRSEAGGRSIAGLAESLPATLLAFDVLWANQDLRERPFGERRAALERLAQTWTAPLLLTPQTGDRAVAQRWFTDFEAAGVDGLIVKDTRDAYQPGKRVQGKVKHQRTADVVVGGWRPHTRPGVDGSPVVGSLLLGLYDDAGALHYVGVCSAFTAARRAELVDLLRPFETDDQSTHPWLGTTTTRIPGTASRWQKGQAWTAIRPELVAEVSYDQMEEGRFRHVASFQHWRPDRAAPTCGFDQLDEPPPAVISDLLG